jgi:hypothetical protein
MNLLSLITSLFLTILSPQESDVQRVTEKFRKALPTDEKLQIYRHDWAGSLEAAKARAAREGRPIFLVTVGNLNGYDNIYTGFC